MDLNDDQTEVLVEFEPQLLVADDTASEAISSVVYEMLVDEYGTLEMLVLEPVNEVLSEESDEASQLLESSPQGVPGPPGPASGTAPSSPQFTYTSGVLSRIDYADGSYKVLAYSSGRLTTVDFTQGAVTTRKTFVYDGNGVLTAINETML